MDKSTPYFLDTSVLLSLIRGKQLGSYLNQTFGLSEVVNRPLISIVTHGELWAMAERNNWGSEKRAALVHMLNDLITLDLNDPQIIEGYIGVDQKSLSNPKGSRVLSDNDKWIAATARATKTLLLTTDQDFLHLHPEICSVHYIDPKSRLANPQTGDQQKLQ